jgi:hypothetical protein
MIQQVVLMTQQACEVPDRPTERLCNPVYAFTRRVDAPTYQINDFACQVNGFAN